MSILTGSKLHAQQRLDLEDMNVLFTGIETDWKYFIQQFWAPTGFIQKGFEVSGLSGPSPALISLANSTLINSDNDGCFSFFVGESTASPLQATLLPSSRNYVELELSMEDGTPLTRAFWDPSAQGGLGAEFNQTVDTVTNLTVSAIVLSGGFSGSPNRIQVAIIDTDSGNNIKLILDKRPLFFREGTPANPQADYAWGSRLEPELTLNLTGVTGTFTAGETVTIGAVTAKVQSGGGSTIGVIFPSSDAVASGATVTGGSSGATGTLSTATSQFTGADKSIDNLREIIQAFATEIKQIKGTLTWPTQTPISLSDIAGILSRPAYAEFISVVSGAPATNQLTGPVTSGTTITIPVNSRLPGSPQQAYEVGKGYLQVYLNGQMLQLGVANGWSQVGSTGAQATTIVINQQLEIGDSLEFRIDGTGGPGAGSGGGGSGAPDDDFVTLPTSGSADNADYILTYDTSASAYRKQLRSVFLAGLNNLLSVNTYTANRNANATSDNVILMNCTSGPLSVFLPLAATSTGVKFDIKKIDSSGNAMTVNGNGVNVDFAATLATSTPGQSISVVCDGIQWWAI